MRLFHVSEQANIKEFVPRIPKRDDMDKSVGLVWAVNEWGLNNFFTPRHCPRVTYCVGEETSPEDITKFFSSSARHVVAIEYGWYKRVAELSLYLYEFNPSNFYPRGDGPGYHVSEHTEVPISMTRIDNMFDRMFERNIEVRILNNLWNLADAARNSTVRWSFRCMANAKPREDR